MRVIPRPLALLLAATCACVPGLAAQEAAGRSPAAPAEVVPRPASEDSARVLRWSDGVIAVGGLSALMLLDHPVQRYAVQNSGAGADNVASVVRHFGQADVILPVTAGIVATGLLLHRPEVTRAGGRVALSLFLAAGATEGAKLAFGRPRPEQSLDADGYAPLSGQVSMPSGHTAMAFAFATALSDEIHRPLATVGLYGLATAVGWSRINDNQHWLSDVATGALLGFTCAKLANGRWRIFNLRPPSIFVTPHSAGLGWQGAF